jgi:hypothetical protein
MLVIESMSQSLADSPLTQVLIYADEPYDFEKVYSLPIFLDFYSGRKVDFFVETLIPDELKPDAYFQGLAAMLDEISLEGGGKILPLRDFDPKKPTLCIYFGQMVESGLCSTTMGLN